MLSCEMAGSAQREFVRGGVCATRDASISLNGLGVNFFHRPQLCEFGGSYVLMVQRWRNPRVYGAWKIQRGWEERALSCAHMARKAGLTRGTPCVNLKFFHFE